MSDYNVKNCVASLSNTGLSNCKDELGPTGKLLWTSDTYEIADYATSILEATWVDDIDAKNIYPMPYAEEVETNIEDNVVQETAKGARIFVREGKIAETLKFRVALCDLPKLRTFNNVSGRVFTVTEDGAIWGTSPDGTKFKGFALSDFHISAMGGTDGSTARMVELSYQMKYTDELADHPAVVWPTWTALDLSGLVDCTVTVDSSAAGSVVLSVARDCDGEAVDGLVVGDFTILASDGTTQMLPGDSFADNADGTYTFGFTTPVLPNDTYTANLKTAAAGTTGGYAPGTADSFTIS